MSDSTIKSSQQAISILQNTGLGELEREHAIKYLQEHPSSEAIDALVTGLEDDDYGVHWACGSALAALGEPAFPALLQALVKPDNSPRLREGTRHVVHYNLSSKVKAESGQLMQALKGSAAGIATIEAAYQLMDKFD